MRTPVSKKVTRFLNEAGSRARIGYRMQQDDKIHGTNVGNARGELTPIYTSLSKAIFKLPLPLFIIDNYIAKSLSILLQRSRLL